MSSPTEELQTEEVVVESPPADGFHDPALAKRIIEAALLAAQDPLSLVDMKKMFEETISNDSLKSMLETLREEWTEKSIELVQVASGWRFRVKPEYQQYLVRMSAEKPPRYSRAVMETLAILAYRQPATRADIEDIRGVQVSPHILKTLEARGWIDQIGTREVPGRPAIFATTKKFLDDLNLQSLEDLPPLDQLQMSLDMGRDEAQMQTEAAVPKIDEQELATEHLADDGAPDESISREHLHDGEHDSDTPGDDSPQSNTGEILH